MLLDAKISKLYETQVSIDIGSHLFSQFSTLRCQGPNSPSWTVEDEPDSRLIQQVWTSAFFLTTMQPVFFLKPESHSGPTTRKIGTQEEVTTSKQWGIAVIKC